MLQVRARAVTWEQRGERKGARRLPEALRQKVIARDRASGRGCYFGLPGCLGINQRRVEVHHIRDAEDGGDDHEFNLITACKPCHTTHSARESQRRSVAKQNEWKRKPEPHPGVLPD